MATFFSAVLTLLVAILVIGLVWSIGKAVIGVLPVEPPMKSLAQTLLYILMLLLLLGVILGIAGWVPGWHIGNIHRF